MRGRMNGYVVFRLRESKCGVICFWILLKFKDDGIVQLRLLRIWYTLIYKSSNLALISGDWNARSLSITRELGTIKEVTVSHIAFPISRACRDLMGIVRPYSLNLSIYQDK